MKQWNEENDAFQLTVRSVDDGREQEYIILSYWIEDAIAILKEYLSMQDNEFRIISAKSLGFVVIPVTKEDSREYLDKRLT